MEPIRNIFGFKFKFFDKFKEDAEIATMVQILEGLGFPVQGIRTDGEHSSHDGTYSFCREYTTFADYSAHVMDDFANETERYKSAAIVDWSSTDILFSTPAGWTMRLFVRKEKELKTYPHVAYLSIYAMDECVVPEERIKTALADYWATK